MAAADVSLGRSSKKQQNIAAAVVAVPGPLRALELHRKISYISLPFPESGL